jgi:hypothetical protein
MKFRLIHDQLKIFLETKRELLPFLFQDLLVQQVFELTCDRTGKCSLYLSLTVHFWIQWLLHKKNMMK